MSSSKLKRTVGLISATSIGLGAMLGAGIFVFPGLAGGDAGFAAVFSFLIGGIIALFTAACTAELATAMPQSGGGYYFISRSFGEFWGTLTGIAQWIGLIFACSFYLVSFGEYALTFLLELNISWLKDTKILSVIFTILLLILNIIGTKKVGKIQNLMVISLTIILVLIFTYGVIISFGLENTSIAFSEITPNGIPSIFSTTALIFTSYLGFVQIANIGAEIKNPSKNLPRSLIYSVLIAMGLYTFIMLVCILTFPQEELKRFGETATIEVARKMLGNWGAILVLFSGLLATLSSANASMISASRGVFALSKDTIITKKANKISKRFGTPHIALLLVTAPVTFLLFKNKLEIFAEVASFLHLIIYAGICLSVLKLRITNPNWYVPTFRVNAAKFTSSVGFLSCLILVVFMQKTSIIIGCGVLLSAIIYYFLYVKKKNITLAIPKPPHIDTKIFNPSIIIPIDISQEKKELPHKILNTIKISKLLLLGYKETPEQSNEEQSEEEFGDEGEEKLAHIKNKLKVADVQFDSKLIFTHEIIPQIKEVIEESQPQFILSLKPISKLKQIVIPILDIAQINKKLITFIYSFYANKSAKIKFILVHKKNSDSSTGNKLKLTIKEQLNLVNISINDYKVIKEEKIAYKKLIPKISEKGDLVVWSESDEFDKEKFLNSIIKKQSKDIISPMIMILK